MRPIGARRAQARRAAAEKMRKAAAGTLRRDAERLGREAEERLRALARAADERVIRFADSSWRQIEKIAAARGISNRHAIAEALSVWEVIVPLLGEGDGSIEFRVRGESRVLLVRRAQTAPDPLATYPR